MDPYVAVESLVSTDSASLQGYVANEAWESDLQITDYGADHAFVKDNYTKGNKCGEAWVYDWSASEYARDTITIADTAYPNTTICI